MPTVLLTIALIVGCCVGAVGIGGILLVPSLTLLAGIPIHEAAATALFTFLFTGLYGTWLFHRRGSIDWRTSMPVCAGSVVFSYIGAWANSVAGTTLLARTVAMITLATSAYILWSTSRRTRADSIPRSPAGVVPLTCIGAAAGFGAGLSGAGGPLFSVPLMLMIGFTPLTAIGTGQVLQIATASFGSLGNLHYGSINWSLAPWLTVGELAGVLLGAHFAHQVRRDHLRAMVAMLCLAAGSWMWLRT